MMVDERFTSIYMRKDGHFHILAIACWHMQQIGRRKVDVTSVPI